MSDLKDDTNRKKKAVVIGATGYVGSAVTKALGEHEISVTCTTRNVDRALWLKDIAIDISIVHFELPEKADESVQLKMRPILRGSDMVFFCAGFEDQSPSTIDFMVSNSVAVIDACKAENVPVVVLTSSGGSTNPPSGLTNSTPKSEILHISDPDEQISRGRYSPAAKTLMERSAFQAVGRNHRNEIVSQELAEDPSTPRLVIINPNLILGPQLDPSPTIKGNSLPWMVRILKKETMNQYIPNDSMSIIDIRDLAELHVSAALDTKASGRYFGVNRSFLWKEILEAFATVINENLPSVSYVPPPLRPGVDYEATIPTQFDHTRKNTLGVTLRSLQETLRDLVDFFHFKGAI